LIENILPYKYIHRFILGILTANIYAVEESRRGQIECLKAFALLTVLALLFVCAHNMQSLIANSSCKSR